MGSACGRSAWALASRYFEGTIGQEPVELTLRLLKTGRCEIRFPTRRGLTYRVQSTLSPGEGGWEDDALVVVRALDSQGVRLDSPSSAYRFFRVLQTLD